MSSKVLVNAMVVLGGTDISHYVQQVSINYQADSVETTAMGDDTHVFTGGLKTWDMSIDLKQDFADNGLDEILFDMVGQEQTIDVRPENAAISASNPSYNGTGLLTSYPPIGNSVGELSKTSISLAAASRLQRSTS